MYLSTLRRTRIAVCVPFAINALLCTVFFHMKTAVEQYDKRKGNTFCTKYMLEFGKHFTVKNFKKPFMIQVKAAGYQFVHLCLLFYSIFCNGTRFECNYLLQGYYNSSSWLNHGFTHWLRGAWPIMGFSSGMCSFCWNVHVFHLNMHKLLNHVTRITWFYNERSMWNEPAPCARTNKISAKRAHFWVFKLMHDPRVGRC